MEGMRSIGLPELLVIVAIVVLIFGVGRISKLGGELGRGIRAFRDGLSGKDDDQTPKDDGQGKSPS